MAIFITSHFAKKQRSCYNSYKGLRVLPVRHDSAPSAPLRSPKGALR